MVLEPRENILDPQHFARPVQWFFKGYSRAQLGELFSAAGVPAKIFNSLHDTQFSEQTEGVLFTPATGFILGLTPESRQKIYDALTPNGEPGRYFDLFLFGPKYLELTLQQTGLPIEKMRLFRSLLYKRGNLAAFSDVSVMLDALPETDAKVAFLKMIIRRPALSVRLKLDRAANLNELSEYWGGPGRAQEVRSFLEHSSGSDGTRAIELTDLLPPFARKRANTLPTSGNALELAQNCHWTSLNFFHEPPNDRFLYIEEVESELTANYAKITTAPQLGDVVLFRNTKGDIVHSAAFIADDIVFTKNGEGPSQPWCFMNVPDVTDLYTWLMGPMSVKVYRRRLA